MMPAGKRNGPPLKLASALFVATRPPRWYGIVLSRFLKVAIVDAVRMSSGTSTERLECEVLQ